MRPGLTGAHAGAAGAGIDLPDRALVPDHRGAVEAQRLLAAINGNQGLHLGSTEIGSHGGLIGDAVAIERGIDRGHRQIAPGDVATIEAAGRLDLIRGVRAIGGHVHAVRHVGQVGIRDVRQRRVRQDSIR